MSHATVVERALAAGQARLLDVNCQGKKDQAEPAMKIARMEGMQIDIDSVS